VKASLVEHLAFADLEIRSSLEAAEVEFEYELYAKGVDLEKLKEMATSVEDQVQWGIAVEKSDKNGGSGSIRVRKTVRDGEEEYTLTVKTQHREKGRIETSATVDKDMFEQFETLAKDGLIKTRYKVPYDHPDHGELELDVDVFSNSKGETVEWIKIDAELPEGSDFKIDYLPFEIGEHLITYPGNDNKQTKELIAELYKKYFRSETKYAA